MKIKILHTDYDLFEWTHYTRLEDKYHIAHIIVQDNLLYTRCIIDFYTKKGKPITSKLTHGSSEWEVMLLKRET